MQEFSPRGSNIPKILTSKQEKKGERKSKERKNEEFWFFPFLQKFSEGGIVFCTIVSPSLHKYTHHNLKWHGTCSFYIVNVFEMGGLGVLP